MLETSLDWFLLHILFHYVITFGFGILWSISCSKVEPMTFWKAALKCLMSGRSFQALLSVLTFFVWRIVIICNMQSFSY